MQRERRRDPYPWTWELPVLLVVGTLILMIAGIQPARSLANLLAGAGWTWPESITRGGYSSPIGTAYWSSIPSVVAGHADAGLSPTPGRVAPPILLWLCLLLTQAGILTVCIRASIRIHHKWGMGRLLGMATSTEAENLLGRARLRKNAAIIRPDLYGKHAEQHAAPIDRDAEQAPLITDDTNIEMGRGLSSPWVAYSRQNAGEGR